MNHIGTKVGVEIEERLDRLSELNPTDEEYKVTADATLKFIDREAKLQELELQSEANKLKEKELEEARKRRHTETGYKVFETVVKCVFYGVMAVGLTIYERNDSTVSTPTKDAWKKVFKLN
jgi:hypothetical protein